MYYLRFKKTKSKITYNIFIYIKVSINKLSFSDGIFRQTLLNFKLDF